MPRRIPAALRWALLVALVGAVVISIGQSWVAAAPSAGGWTQTRWGPLGPADRDLLQKVRLAGLWEAPTGQQAQQQAVAPAVKEVGAHLAGEHAQLDVAARETADKLGVLLPSRPSDQQLGWMNQLSGLTGTDYDRAFIQIVRAAHGTVLPLIAEVRSGTRNQLMRQFADTADQYVGRHIGYLESTGLVDYSALPEPPEPAPAPGTSGAGLIVPALVVLGALLAAIGLLTTLRRRPRPHGDAPDLLHRPLRALGGRAILPAPRPVPDIERDGPGTGARRTQSDLVPAHPTGPDPWDELGNAPPGRRARRRRPDHDTDHPIDGHHRRDTWS
ncbi:putative outer membrane protein [Pseudonocardia sediminis]|uniref:Putative outer membrane protein n=1 Tax=Pseudonocardia sediminis TaxID=1397368 RepID=A0A4Q7UPG3_PSEST|nr:DUF4142 domain-containing protein [Pseudonocardia sediminis]RZT83485.1 putative outer membrane protein [Pseudonocardia sediminis]